MREIRQSGSVEGVMGDHDSYSDSPLEGTRPMTPRTRIRASERPADEQSK